MARAEARPSRRAPADVVPGARPAPLPAFVPPQLATLVKRAPPGDEWLHEVKFDGYRILARLADGRARLVSRTGKDWTGSFPEVARAVARLPVRQALLDGEVAVMLPDGTTSFQALQNAGAEGARGQLAYLVFDLLHLDGHDLTGARLEDRKAVLERLLRAAGPRAEPLRYSAHVRGAGPEVFARACRLGVEGVVCKRRDAPYRSARTLDWLKVKCVKEQEVVIGGYTDPEGARAGFGALLAGVNEDGRLAYAGKIGTGFTERTLRELLARLRALGQSECPFTPRPTGVGRPHWVKPELVAQVTFTEWTEDGKLRHPSFRGLREDKPPGEVVREVAASAPPPAGSAGNGPRATDPARERGARGDAPVAAISGGRGRRSTGAAARAPDPARGAAPTKRATAGARAARAAGTDPRGKRAAARTAAGARDPARATGTAPGGTRAPARTAAGMRGAAAAATGPSAPAPSGRRGVEAEVAGVRLSHADRVLYPPQGTTKLDLARFYESIAEWILPHLRDRPTTLVRCPEGAHRECFYQKHVGYWAPEPVRRVKIVEKTKVGEYLVVDTLPALVGLVQIGILEIHTWNSVVERLERPDRIVFDLDPAPDVPWPRVPEAARHLRVLLRELRLESFVKTTGGKGLHVVVPLRPGTTWEDGAAFARAIADRLVAEEPRRYVATMAKSARAGKIFIDYLRNVRGATSVAAYSTRARPEAPVSVPLEWDELTPRLRSDHYTIATLPRRLRGLRADPWARYWTAKQDLPALPSPS